MALHVSKVTRTATATPPATATKATAAGAAVSVITTTATLTVRITIVVLRLLRLFATHGIKTLANRKTSYTHYFSLQNFCHAFIVAAGAGLHFSIYNFEDGPQGPSAATNPRGNA